MNGHCTCGAELPPDARFCHKCGKPQFELPVAEPETEAAPTFAPQIQPPPAAADAGPHKIGLRNRVAVRVAFLAGSTTALMLMLPMPPLFQILWQFVMLLVGGFFAVWLYQRRTGNYLSVRSGAHLGWLAGMFCFLIMMVMFTISMVAIATAEGLQESFREMLTARGTPEVADQLNALLSSPGGLFALLFGMLLTTFLMLSVLATVGGALGAKVLEKE